MSFPSSFPTLWLSLFIPGFRINIARATDVAYEEKRKAQNRIEVMSVTKDSDLGHGPKCARTNIEVRLDNDTVRNINIDAASTWSEVDRKVWREVGDHG